MDNNYDRTYMAIDYGRRRIGVAKSDPTGTIASALTTLEVGSRAEALAALSKLLEEYQPNGLVVGYPLHASGDKSDLCREIDGFVEQLKVKGVFDGPIEIVDEYGSSKLAEDIIHAHGRRVGQDKKRIDRLAAVVILQRFLDEKFGR